MTRISLFAASFIALGFALLAACRWRTLRWQTRAARERRCVGVLALMLGCLVVACLAGSAVGQRVAVENPATAPQRAWTFVGLPAAVVPVKPGVADTGWPFVPVPAIAYGPTSRAGGVWLLCDLPGNARRIVELAPATATTDAVAAPPRIAPFVWAVDPTKLVPKFWAYAADGTTLHWSEPPQFWPDGAPRPAGAFLRRLEADAAHETWHLRTRIRPLALTIDWWSRAGSGCTTVEWTVHMVYGDVGGGPISVNLGRVGLEVPVEPVVDFRVRVGLPTAAQEAGKWGQVLMHPAAWGRASRVEVRGALLPVDDQARRQRPIGAVFTGWDGNWLALGVTPAKWSGSDALSASRRVGYLNPPGGSMYDQRPGGQPKVSGTTGEQGGDTFGATNGAEMVTQLSAWAVDDAKFHAQVYAMRPCSNRELNGDPIKAADHPKAKTIGLRPDDRFSDGDALGWYQGVTTAPQIPYSWPGSGYTSPDSQHRADGLLDAMYALTREPAYRAILEDYIELQKLEYVRPGEPGGPGAPRALGRTMLAHANMVWLGFPEARTFIDASLGGAMRGSWASTPNDATHPVRVLTGTDEAKYGWLFANGQKIYGWQGWQETIAAIGLLAAHRVTGDPRGRDLALMLSRTCTDQCFYRWQQETGYRHTYAQRWRHEDPGSAHPPESWFPTQPNYDMFTAGDCSRWTLASARIFLLLAPADDPLRAKALELAAAAPRNNEDARWWAVGR